LAGQPAGPFPVADPSLFPSVSTTLPSAQFPQRASDSTPADRRRLPAAIVSDNVRQPEAELFQPSRGSRSDSGFVRFDAPLEVLDDIWSEFGS
jgi:hypothetical protein